MRLLPLLLVSFLALSIIPQAQADFEWVKFEQGRKITIEEILSFKEGDCTEAMSMKLSFVNIEANYSIYFKLFPITGKNSVYLHDGWSLNYWLDTPNYSVGVVRVSDGTPSPGMMIESNETHILYVQVCPGPDAKENTYYEVGLIIALQFNDKEEIPGGIYNQSHGIWFTYTLEKEDPDWTIAIILFIVLIVVILITLNFRREKKSEPPQ